MPLFTSEDQEALAVHIQEAQNACEEKNECWDEAENIEVEERWLARRKTPAGHARVITEMDAKGERPPVEWRPPYGRARSDEAHVDDGKAERVKRVGEFNNYRSVGNSNLSAAVLNSSSFYSKF